MKKIFLVIPLVIILFAAVFGVAYFWWNKNAGPVSSSESNKRFVIVRGASAVQIANNLQKEGLIKSPLAFKIYVQTRNKASKIQAGEYILSPHLSMVQIVDELLEGPDELWVTIPEGLRREEIPDKFISSLKLAEARAEQFREEFLVESEGKEGYLFPDTYLFPRDVTGKQVITTMQQTFNKVISPLQNDIKESSYSLEQLVTLASIIERETKTQEERPIVAGIYFNRLEIGMPLQADATAQYAHANINCKAQGTKCDWWPTLLRDDLEINSPFNTYKISGIPPSPIANPGATSLEAVVQPQETDYLYYIHDDEGQIYYAETLDEHNQNVRTYLQ